MGDFAEFQESEAEVAADILRRLLFARSGPGGKVIVDSGGSEEAVAVGLLVRYCVIFLQRESRFAVGRDTCVPEVKDNIAGHLP